ncbi:F-box protein, partial [Trifolium medium]|nr:F-box protein [Trifolium medium]
FITVFLPCLEIFSLRDNAWKEIEDTPFPYWSTNRYPILGLFFNGAIHWRFSRGSSVDVIVGFSLLERKLFEIPLPSDFGRCFLDIGSWVFGEFLSLWTTRDGIVEIWVMKEYKVHSSWTKTLVIPIPGEIYDEIPCFYPMCCENSGDIIGTDGRSALVKYNVKGQLLGHYSFCNHPRGSEVVMYTESLLSVVMYTESLLSLPGNHEQV